VNRQSQVSKIATNRSLGPGVPPEVRIKYPHMLSEDHAAWTAFIESEWNMLDEVWYDVHVGAPMDLPRDSPNYMKAVVDGVSRKRIDVVGRDRGMLWIIEVKPFANMTAIGQVVTYAKLFNQEFDISPPALPMIVSMTLDRDILEIGEHLGVKMLSMDGVTL